MVNAPVCICCCSILFLLHHLWCLTFSVGAAVRHCSLVSQIWPSHARLRAEIPSSRPHLLPNVAVLSFSLPMVLNIMLSLCFYSLSCNHKQQTAIRAKARLDICRTGRLRYSEGKPETFPPQTYQLVLSTATASDGQKPQFTARLLWVSPCLNFPPSASQDKAGFCSPAQNGF